MTRVSLTALVGATVAASQAWANGEHGQGLDQHGHMWGGGFGMAFGFIMMIVVIAAIVGVIVLVVRWLGAGPSRRPATERTALDILEERFARGEIDAQEFQDRRRTLEE